MSTPIDDNGDFWRLSHNLLRELGWTHGELTPSIVHQALAQVRHLKKQAAEVERMRPVCDAAIAWSESFGELSKRLPPHVHQLRDAVDAYQATTRKPLS